MPFRNVMERTGSEFEEAAKNLQNVKIVTRECVTCGYELGIIINDGNVFFDSGCNCGHFGDIQPIKWDAFADYYNHFTNQENIDEVDMIFGFK